MKVVSSSARQRWGAKGVKHTVPSDENPAELINILPLKPGVGQNITTHASLTSIKLFTALILTFPVHSH